MVNVFDTSVEPFAVRGVLPMVMSGIEVLHVSPADLQRRVYVQVLVERRDRTLGLARRVVELGMGTVFELGNIRRPTVVYYQADVLKNGKRNCLVNREIVGGGLRATARHRVHKPPCPKTRQSYAIRRRPNSFWFSL